MSTVNARTPLKHKAKPPDAKASPEIRSAIASLRAKAKSASSKQEKENVDPLTLFATEQGDALGLPSCSSIISKASQTGRLNLSSRALNAIPQSVYQLLPPSSLFHPDNKAPSQFKVRKHDLTISSDRQTPNWYEAKPLTWINLAANEIDALEEDIEGFADTLTHLDLHSNSLAQLPASLLAFSNLTVLNLSYNKLNGAIPVPLLALEALITLDLSHNSISQLWPVQWRAALSVLQEQRKANQSDLSADSSADSDFWSSFPSAIHAKSNHTIPKTSSPFPSLKTLNLSHNSLSNASFSDENQFIELPINLNHLHLSANRFQGPLPNNIFFPLNNLVNLSLADNSLQDNIFSPPSDNALTILSALKTLDLSTNSIESLEQIEKVFAGRSISWTGLSKPISALVGKQNFDGLTVLVQGNHLRHELQRRRLLARRTPTILDTSLENNVQESTSTLDHDSFENITTKQEADEAVSAAPPTVSMSADGKLDLSSRKMTTLPAYERKAVIHLDLRKNAFSALPMSAIEVNGWSQLKTLNLSQNKISLLDDSLRRCSLPVLEDLHLSSNKISNEEALEIISAFAPKLKHLDLTYNYLPSLKGVSRLLLRQNGGIQYLKLSGNKISELTELVQVALQIQTKEQEVSAFRCVEIDISDNAISKLDPLLGFLPLDTFSVSGNTFRIPQRRVYEEGGTKGLLKYLRDRVA